MHDDPILLRGQALYKEGHGKPAHAIFEAYLQSHPHSVDARIWLARLARRNFDFPRAKAYLEAALALNPNRSDAVAELAYLYYQWSVTPVGEPALYMAKAGEQFRQSQALGPENPWVLTYLAEYQLAQEDRISAEHNLRKVIQQYPTFIPAYQGLIRFYIAAGDVSRAKDTALYAVELDAENALSHFLIAQLMAKANQPAEAVRYARRSEQLDFGRLPERDAFLAQELERLGELKDAAMYYERLVGYADTYSAGWLKLGEIYERLSAEDPSLEARSLSAYRKALSLDPGIMTSLVQTAREALRAERPAAALPQWRKVLTLSQDVNTQEQAIGALASLHYWTVQNGGTRPANEIRSDLGRWDYFAPENPSAKLLMDRIKLEASLAKAEGQVNPLNTDHISRLNILGMNEPDPSVAGEAHFLLGQYGQAREHFSLVDGLSAEQYTALADRLLLERALVFATVFYQRAYELSPHASLEVGINKIKQKKASAEQALQEGNRLFAAEQYAEATASYRQATELYPEWETAYLRLADTLQAERKWPEAYTAFEKATALNPGLLDSEGFNKNLAKVRKKAGK